MEQKWVQAWGMSHAGMSLLGYRGNDRTFRLTVHSAVSGGQIRLSLSNRFSKERVRVGSAYAAVCDETGRRIGESTPLFFAGKAGVELTAGQSVRSDAAALPVAAGEYLSVSIYAINLMPVSFLKVSNTAGFKASPAMVQYSRLDRSYFVRSS